MRRSLKIECLVWMDNVTTFPLNVAALFFLCVYVRMLESSKNYTRSTTITQNMIDIIHFRKYEKKKKYCSISNRYRIPEMNVTISIEFLCLLACGVHRLHKFWSSFSYFDFVDGHQTTQAFINTKRRNRKSSFTLLSVTAFETDKVWEFEKKTK